MYVRQYICILIENVINVKTNSANLKKNPGNKRLIILNIFFFFEHLKKNISTNWILNIR